MISKKRKKGGRERVTKECMGGKNGRSGDRKNE
jgi:hypothetical protein